MNAIQSRPFFAADPRMWPAVASVLPKPWPIEAIYTDLAYWQDQEARKRGKRPGRPALVKRWGVTDWQVVQALKAESEWGDTSKPSRHQPTTSAPPARHQRATSAPPADEWTNAENGDVSASAPPADHQPTTSAPPADHPTRVYPPSTVHRPPSTTDSAPAEAAADVCQHASRRAGEGSNRKSRTSIPDEVLAVWTEYRDLQMQPPPDAGPDWIGIRRGDHPPKGWGFLERIADSGPATVLAVVRWAHLSMHPRAVHLRHNGFIGETLFRPTKFPEYAAIATRWSNAGERDAVQAVGMNVQAATSPAEAEWDAMSPHLARVASRGLRTAKSPSGVLLGATEDEHARRLATFERAGGWSSWRDATNDWQRDQVKRRWIAAWGAK